MEGDVVTMKWNKYCAGRHERMTLNLVSAYLVVQATDDEQTFGMCLVLSESDLTLLDRTIKASSLKAAGVTAVAMASLKLYDLQEPVRAALEACSRAIVEGVES